MGCTASSTAKATATPPQPPTTRQPTKNAQANSVTQSKDANNTNQRESKGKSLNGSNSSGPEPINQQVDEIVNIVSDRSTVVQPVKTEVMERGSFSVPKEDHLHTSNANEAESTDVMSGLPSSLQSTLEAPERTAVSLDFEVEINPNRNSHSNSTQNIVTDPIISPPPIHDTKAPAGSIDFQKMLIDDRVQELIRSDKTDENKLYDLFKIFDEDNDGMISSGQVDEVIWMTEASYIHSSPCKGQLDPLQIETTETTNAKNQGPINGEATYIDSPHPETPVTASSVSMTGGGLSNTPSLSPIGLGRATGPPKKSTAAKKKLVHSPLVTTPASSTAPSSSANTLDDFADVPSTPAVPLPKATTNNNTTPLSSAIKRAAERKPNEVEELNIPPELIPPQKKGFLRVTTSLVATPNSKAKYHVLDAGTLYHLDSLNGSGSFSMDRRGISLKDRVVSGIIDKNALILKRPAHFVSTDEGDDAEITIEIKGGEKEDWINAFKTHMDFADSLKKFQNRGPE